MLKNEDIYYSLDLVKPVVLGVNDIEGAITVLLRIDRDKPFMPLKVTYNMPKPYFNDNVGLDGNLEYLGLDGKITIPSNSGDNSYIIPLAEYSNDYKVEFWAQRVSGTIQGQSITLLKDGVIQPKNETYYDVLTSNYQGFPQFENSLISMFMSDKIVFDPKFFINQLNFTQYLGLNPTVGGDPLKWFERHDYHVLILSRNEPRI